MDALDGSLLWSFTTTAAVPPVPVPAPEAVVPGGVLVLPGINRRIFARWRRDVREFWIEYFIEIAGLSKAEANARTDEILEAADQMEDVSPREFWRDYFRKVELESQKEYLIQMDDEEILNLL